MSNIEIGKIYKGEPDFKNGYSSNRTVLFISEDGTIVFLRNEFGDCKPSCYVSMFGMSKEEFISWTNEL